MKKLIYLLSLSILCFPSDLKAQAADTQARLKSVPSVTYPAEAGKTGLAGQVMALVDIDVTGKVTKAHEPTGPDWICPNVNRADVLALRKMAREAAQMAVFAPAVKDGRAVESQMLLQFKFTNPSEKKPTEGGLSMSGYRVDRVARADGVTKDPEPSTATGETKTIPGGVLTGSPKSLPQPAYPAAARAVKAAGTVNVQVIIDTNGTIFWSEAVEGHPLLRSAARLAACSARFAPILLAGEPVMVSGIIKYNFVL